jgi:hypothetical protein
VFNLACELGYMDIVDDMLDYGGVNPAEYHGGAMNMAAARGHLPVVKRLFQDERIKLTRSVLTSADTSGCEALIELLMKRAMGNKKVLLGGPHKGVKGGVLHDALRAQQTRSMSMWLMCTKRTQGVYVAARVIDVLRDAYHEWIAFDIETC